MSRSPKLTVALTYRLRAYRVNYLICKHTAATIVPDGCVYTHSGSPAVTMHFPARTIVLTIELTLNKASKIVAQNPAASNLLARGLYRVRQTH